MSQSLCLLGATGSIGVSTLDVVRANPERFTIAGLSAHSRVDELAEQVREFKPTAVALGDAGLADRLRDNLGADMPAELFTGPNAVSQLVEHCDAQMLVNALVGAVGLKPTLLGIERGMTIALANKETMVVAGELVSNTAEKHNVDIIPIDSEHNAIWQCLAGEKPEHIRHIWLTASGGPFRARPAETFADITREEALNHPNWDMGPKITIDSATMMNKGLEVIEARWLFHQPVEKICIVVHPQSIIHSMVEFTDGSFKAQLGAPDMRLPIQYALGYPERLSSRWEAFNPLTAGALEFHPPDPDKFPALRLAFEALQAGGTMPAVMNAANEAAVALFLDNAISFADISRVVDDVMQRHNTQQQTNLEALLEADQSARRAVQEICRNHV
jgi:1-deoxy-D-xylulose-5-phosphate reductoisomerase